MKRLWIRSSFACVALLLATSFAEAGQRLYSINSATNELVTIDVDNGAVAVVGSLGREVRDIDLAMLDGRLYGLSTDFAARRAELLEIDAFDGSSTLLGNLAVGSTRATHAESLGSTGGRLYAGFTLSPSDTTSGRLGAVSLTGAITGDVAVGTDLDGLAADALGRLHGIDSVPPGTVHLDALQPTQRVASYINAGLANDLVFSQGFIYMIFHQTSRLSVVDAATRQLVRSVDLSVAGEYFGLEVVAVPEPTTLALAGLGITTPLLARRLRRPSR
ncbi:MAG: PEP-CTERM sorting domain-containing protein [Isosphaeraceae bacterium]|nr:PEP-CTERM sorting domain-containing protein [Isosphaeraceae bacterium]